MATLRNVDVTSNKFNADSMYTSVLPPKSTKRAYYCFCCCCCCCKIPTKMMKAGGDALHYDIHKELP